MIAARAWAAAVGVVAVTTAAALGQVAPSSLLWGQVGGGPERGAWREGAAAPVLGSPRWVLAQTAGGQAIDFEPSAGVVAATLPAARVYAVGRIGVQAVAVSVDAETGQVVWTAPVPAAAFGSWSTPALDVSTGLLLVAAGTSVVALRTADGGEAWRATLAGPVVNASPLVVSDLGPPGVRSRAFITDYGGFGGPGSLYCINLSPRDAGANPFDPGQVLWAAPIGSSTGATPAAIGGLVVVTSTGLDSGGAGQMRAFDARATVQPSPVWVFDNPVAEGFFGGVSLAAGADGTPYAYAASYAFWGELDSANLVKVNARTGALVWSAPCNRTSSTPIVLANGDVLLSGGVDGFGSVPTVERFTDLGAAAQRQWNTAVGSWVDGNGNSVIDAGEYLVVGGWSTQPAVVGGRWVVVGVPPTETDPGGGYRRLLVLDANGTPGQSGFVAGMGPPEVGGSTPALLGRGTYSVGLGGLAAFGAAPPRADVDGNGAVTVDDLYAWETPLTPAAARDVDRDGSAGDGDRRLLTAELRRGEAGSAAGRGRAWVWTGLPGAGP